MTKTYIAKRLLEHGPLMFHEFREITGWRAISCRVTLERLVESCVVKTEKRGRLNVYRLA